MNFTIDNDGSFNEFNLNYLDSASCPSLPNIDPQIAFQNAFETHDADKSVYEFLRNITGPKIWSGLAKAVNAALSV